MRAWPRAVATSVYIVPESQKLGVIMDVDDTVMVTMLPRPMVAAWNSLHSRRARTHPHPGMAVMTDRIRRSHPDAPFMYLSTGAWNITPTLAASSAATATRAARSCSPTGAPPRPLVPPGTNHKVESPTPPRRGIPADEVDPRR